MSLKEIVWPTKLKVLVTFLIPIAYFTLIIAVNSNFRQAFLSADAITQTTGILAFISLGAVIYYPLACGAVYLYQRLSGEEKTEVAEGKKPAKRKAATQDVGSRQGRLHSKNRDLLYAIILIAVFNPLTYSGIFATYNYVNLNVFNHPCGVEVMGYREISPARDSYMVTGEIITMADGQRIDTTDSLLSALAAKSPNDTMIVQTNVRTYSIKLAEDAGTGKAILGIITQTVYCPTGKESSQQASAPKAAIDACMSSCIHTRDAGDKMESGPCLLDPIPVEPDWVCDIAHSPRMAADNLPENQCSFYRSGNSTHFIELDNQCNLIRAA